MGAGDKYSVLLAEELTLVREGIAVLCESTGEFEVVGQCGDGAEAVEMIQSCQPSLAVLDFSLPMLCPLEGIRRLRESGCPTKIVVLSIRGDRKTVVEALRVGASAFVLKNGPARHLLDAFRQVLQGGVYVSPLIAIDKIFVPGRKAPAGDRLDSLSAREYQVFSLIIDGLRAKEIAARLDLSPKTVCTYRSSLMRKLDIHDVPGLVKFAITRNLTTMA